MEIPFKASFSLFEVFLYRQLALGADDLMRYFPRINEAGFCYGHWGGEEFVSSFNVVETYQTYVELIEHDCVNAIDAEAIACEHVVSLVIEELKQFAAIQL